MSTDRREILISVDVETSGPIPGVFSMLSLGACAVHDTAIAFECTFKPISDEADPAALEVTGLDLDTLRRTGMEPEAAMSAFASWISEVVGADENPVLVGFNAPFDWSFVNYYFHRFTGANPFGFTALDIKALWMGVSGCSWTSTRSSRMAAELRPTTRGDHDALHDARHQAELLRLVLARRQELGGRLRGDAPA